MNRSIYWIMALAAGLVVANNYYNQPLLVDFARTFHATERQTGAVSVAAQLGYALGLLLFVPLGDKLERRALIGTLLGIAAVSLGATALSLSLPWLIAASFVTGLVSVAPQLLTPFAAHLAGPSRRGKAVGIVMFGLLCGILVSRTVSGTVAAHFGWRSVYWIAAAAMILVAVMLWRALPVAEPTFDGSYRALMRSLWTLLRDEPLVRQTSGIAALQFAAFSAFWTTLAFHLHSFDAHYGSEVAGMFGLVGVVGAGASTMAGKWTDAGNPRLVVLVSSLVFVAAYTVFAFAGSTIAGLVVGVILLDLGMQTGHVSNLARNMSVRAGAMSRTNTLYMTIRFGGGALGSAVGNYAWSLWRWPGVCGVGLMFAVASLALQASPEGAGKARMGRERAEPADE